VNPPATNSAGKTLSYPNIHLAEGQKFVLEGYRDNRKCGGDMWAGQGWTVGRADKDNYVTPVFVMRDPDLP
jgi:hypothetical protein